MLLLVSRISCGQNQTGEKKIIILPETGITTHGSESISRNIIQDRNGISGTMESRFPILQEPGFDPVLFCFRRRQGELLGGSISGGPGLAHWVGMSLSSETISYFKEHLSIIIHQYNSVT